MGKNSEVILTVCIEVVGVGLLALLAGSNDDAGKMIVLFMSGLVVVMMVTHPSLIQKIASFPQNAARAV